MIRLLVFDIWRWFAPTRCGLRSALRRDLVAIPPRLRADMGLSDARLADLVEAQLCHAVAARQAEEAGRLLGILNAIARKRGFPRLCWQSEGPP